MYIGKVKISCYSLEELLIISKSLKHIITVNSEAIVRAHDDLKLLNIIKNRSATIDGQIPLWIFKRKYSQIKIEKLSGSDIIYDICDWASKNNLKIFLLGGNELSNELSVQKLNEKYNVVIEGFSPKYSSYPFEKTFNDLILEKIRLFSPDVIFVAFGMGKQEYWISDNRKNLENIGVKMAIGCGGTFDFVAGKIKRAPIFVQKIGLEGIWRFVMEPKWFRFKRILLSLKIFYYTFK